MSQIYLCFVWHMHQPFYRDLVSGEYKLPWTRMHGLKDYYGMVAALRDFPSVRQTFNLVPSMLVQLDEYASGQAADPFLKAALKPAEELTEQEREFILQYFFQANPSRLIYRYPRYGELFDAWLAADRNPRRALRFFDSTAIRDLQVLSQLAWWEEEKLTGDPEIVQLVARHKHYTTADQELLGRKQIELLGEVVEIYREFAARGQIEISTTPFYHPILPLLCDSNVAEVSHPYLPLPSRFRYPQDARAQLERARAYVKTRLGTSPAGLWPSEGSISDDALAIAAEAGFRWAASDNGVLSRSLAANAGPDLTYRPYLWRQGGKSIHLIFRDHYLSDLIGFVYSRMDAAESAAHFLDRIRENCRGILSSGRDALVPVILDGENAWEHYDRNGRPFLNELYRRIAADPQMSAVTVSEALEKIEPQPLDRLVPGSWINANFDIWIGSEEDNKAWEYLLRARQAYDRVLNGPDRDTVDQARKDLAYEELLIAEGSDWCWWYGPEHDSANRPEFDCLFRDHLANAYRALGLMPPDELSRPILKTSIREYHQPPTGPIRPVIDGEVTSYFEWLGAGSYKVDSRSGAMHGRRYLISELRYGSDGSNLYLRMDLVEEALPSLAGMEVRIEVQRGLDGAGISEIVLGFEHGSVRLIESRLAEPDVEDNKRWEFAFQKVLEARMALPALGVPQGHSVRFQLSLWAGGLPVDALPQHGWLEFSTAEPSEWPI